MKIWAKAVIIYVEKFWDTEVGLKQKTSLMAEYHHDLEQLYLRAKELLQFPNKKRYLAMVQTGSTGAIY